MKDAHPYPVVRIGVIGGGQLGRMLVMAAQQLGCETVVLDPQPGSPAGQLAGHQIVGSFQEAGPLRTLVEAVDVTTFDIESINAQALIALEAEGHKIFPSPSLLATIQDKLTQKQFLADAGIPTSPFQDMPEPDADAFAAFGYPLVQKARRGGYDGRGVAVMRSESDFENRLECPGLVEKFVPAQMELAVMVARGQDKSISIFPVVEMGFHGAENILDKLSAPARVSPEITAAAQDLARRTVEAMDGVGIFGVEMFLSESGDLLINEVAPRTHNSGHYTIEACVTDQFEQHLRAIAGLPLGCTDQLQPAVMFNVLGEPGYTGRPVIEGLSACLAIPGVSVHMYGKTETRPHRKMGHVTVVAPELEVARERASTASKLLKITGDQKL